VDTKPGVGVALADGFGPQFAQVQTDTVVDVDGDDITQPYGDFGSVGFECPGRHVHLLGGPAHVVGGEQHRALQDQPVPPGGSGRSGRDLLTARSG